MMGRLGLIRNFTWVRPGILARGEQPHDRDYQELRRIGIDTVLSLREVDAPQQPGWEAYRATGEAEVCAAVGLAFQNIPCVDKFIPEPDSIFAALSVLDEEFAAGRSVYMHCLYGVGRTGLVSAAWGMARADQGLTEAGDLFFDSFKEMYTEEGVSIESYESHHREYQVLAHWWAIRTMAAALGLPTDVPDPFPSEPPANALDWESACRHSVNQWRFKNRFLTTGR